MSTEGGRDDYFHHHTLPSLKVGKILLTERNNDHWNYELALRTGVSQRAVHSILRRFKAMSWVSRKTERPQPIGRQARVFYLLTDTGTQAMREALDCLQMAST